MLTFPERIFYAIILYWTVASSPFTVELTFAQCFCMKKMLQVICFTVAPEMHFFIGSITFITFNVALC